MSPDIGETDMTWQGDLLSKGMIRWHRWETCSTRTQWL